MCDEEFKWTEQEEHNSDETIQTIERLAASDCPGSCDTTISLACLADVISQLGVRERKALGLAGVSDDVRTLLALAEALRYVSLHGRQDPGTTKFVSCTFNLTEQRLCELLAREPSPVDALCACRIKLWHAAARIRFGLDNAATVLLLAEACISLSTLARKRLPCGLYKVFSTWVQAIDEMSRIDPTNPCITDTKFFSLCTDWLLDESVPHTRLHIEPIVALGFCHEPRLQTASQNALKDLSHKSKSEDLQRAVQEQLIVLEQVAQATLMNNRIEAIENLPEWKRNIVKRCGLRFATILEEFDIIMNCLLMEEKATTEKPPKPAHERLRVDTLEVQSYLRYEDPTKAFKFLEQLAVGGFGSVHLCRRVADKEQLAVKIVNLDDNWVWRTTKREVRFLSRLHHESIVRLETAYAFDTNLWIVMEFCDGGSLRRLMSIMTFDEFESLYICRGILEGLKYLHSNDIVHCDIKPENILLNSEGTVKLADLGLSRKLKNGVASGIRGSKYWMAPEMIKGQEYNCSLDIWSFGCVLFECATGNPPYYRAPPIMAMYSVAKLGPPSLQTRTLLSAGFKKMLQQTLNPCPAERPTCVELLENPLFADLEKDDVRRIVSEMYFQFNLAESGIM
mmetsp:Transcript_20749/g.52546  ORF Transcript_20749/g.52546 Transcript_20749/m.52546 type:complete len:624 (+) Transcript_20749:194-2065(+)